MSVLNTIKGKIVTVQHDITHGIRSLTTKEAADNVNAVVDSGVINWNAGADLLQRYQQYWSELHHASEKNAKKAQEVGILVAKVFQFFEQQNSAMNQFLSEVSAIQLLVAEVNDAKDKISKIEGSFGEVETLLLELEDVCDQNDMQRKQLEHEYQLAKYRHSKSLELERNKGTMAAKHASKVQQFEAHVMATLKERSKVFDDAFHEQLENYRKTGRVEMLSTPAESPDKKTDLSDIKIEDDPTVLDEFLDADDQTAQSGHPDGKQSTESYVSDGTSEFKINSDSAQDLAANADEDGHPTTAARTFCDDVQIDDQPANKTNEIILVQSDRTDQ